MKRSHNGPPGGNCAGRWAGCYACSRIVRKGGARIARRPAGRGPRMQHGADPGIIDAWTIEAGKVPGQRDRRILAHLTLTFAALARRRAAWHDKLEGWAVIKSDYLEELREEVRSRGPRRGAARSGVKPGPPTIRQDRKPQAEGVVQCGDRSRPPEAHPRQLAGCRVLGRPARHPLRRCSPARTAAEMGGDTEQRAGRWRGGLVRNDIRTGRRLCPLDPAARHVLRPRPAPPSPCSALAWD